MKRMGSDSWGLVVGGTPFRRLKPEIPKGGISDSAFSLVVRYADSPW
jgi:hypothetical protein